ncbi:aminodeoxychorismate synthase component I [Pseudarthrobacter sp. J64]|uniref:aminodeoxychorismate synthase component I n=1 Tax=Pseudarthrobacter sp. J64 TaxID=3116485 RepID=UPI002E817EEC|nr:aminodeoxychorismate synthase component I [Pseudarthrobacter sp. J64]MEE2568885.1 aminodeoxychorismate synthase component I [Pseudarthrobacter sp. J64]
MIPAPVIIAVDGRSGAGKTTLATELAVRLRAHHKVSLFHLEDIYPGWDGLADGILRYVTTVLVPLRRGERATWTSWDWENNNDGGTRVTEPAEIVLIEGVGAASAAARPLLDAVVWAESPMADRRVRALARDGGSYDPFWERWAAQEDALLRVDNVPAHADVVVENLADGTAPDDVLAALAHLPALSTALQPELAARRGGLKLLTRKLNGRPDAAALFERLYGGSANAVWLDSSNADQVPASAVPEPRNRFSILADDAGTFGQAVSHSSGTTTVTTGRASVRVSGPFFRWLDGMWGRKAVRTPQDYPGDFTLGWLGYLGYELKRETGGTNVASPLPDVSLLFAGRAVVLDHVAGTVWLLALDAPDAGTWLAEAAKAVAAVGPSPEPAADPPKPAPRFTARDGELEYKAKIAEAQREIGDGNSYEVCLTTALSAEAPDGFNPWPTYLQLRRRNPAPFAAYLRFDGVAVASTSPERFLKITSDGGMRAEPIKGTRRRGADAAADEALRRDLAESPKDRAENIMIVDLLRNDLSHFAVPGSVQVSRLCAIESYATVHQMVSTIDAQLLPGTSRAEAVAACFPAGSMTGAPKISTMAILDRLENAPRGVYSGAIGYFSLNGATDLSVAIRTLVAGSDGAGGTELSLGVGGAITADSDPADEYQEIRDKAFGVLSALGAEYPAAAGA